jgi:hypothetical protein
MIEKATNQTHATHNVSRAKAANASPLRTCSRHGKVTNKVCLVNDQNRPTAQLEDAPSTTDATLSAVTARRTIWARKTKKTGVRFIDTG